MSTMTVALVVFEYVVMLLSISLHDAAQAWMADRRGDPTARMLGRISINPMRHFDPFGMLLWPLIYIWRSPLILGWGQPVPMTARNFRTRRDEVLAILAGPAAQFGVAVIALLALLVIKHTVPGAGQNFGVVSLLAADRVLIGDGEAFPPIFPLLLFLYFCILMNLLLCVFNLMPLPILDGGRILVEYLPYEAARTFEQYSLPLMFVFMFLGFGIVLKFFEPLLNVFNGLLAQ